MGRPIKIMISILSFLALVAQAFDLPSQVHLSYHGKGERSVSWVTFTKTPQSLFLTHYGDPASTISPTIVISATTEVFNEPQDKTQVRYLHHANFPVKNGLYSYYVGTEDEKVGKFEFEVKDYDDFLNIMAYGDMGLENAQTFDLVNEAIGLLDADILLHIGDFCYDMYEDKGNKSDQWMDFIMPVAANIPFQTTSGNHEYKFNFTHYESRYKHVSSTANPHFYSFDMGPVHFLFYTTEFYYYDVDKSWGKQRLLDQVEFVKADLAQANKNRDVRPWIITMGHRPMYCSNGNHEGACLTEDTFHRNGTLDGVKVGLEEIFHTNKVDLCLSGHEHSYERTFPVYNYKVSDNDFNNTFLEPSNPIHVITGAAGNRENLASFVDPQPDWSINRFDDYSISFMKVNKEELKFYQVDHEQKFIDSFTIQKDFVPKEL